MNAVGPLKALAMKVLAREPERDRPGVTSMGRPDHGQTTDDTCCSAVPGSGDGTMERGAYSLADLHRSMLWAQDWKGLHAVVDDAQMAYVAGEISGEEVDGLAAACARRAQDLPEYAPTDPSPSGECEEP